jgi:CRP/FNR family cyclic AMP-dependent transcriptional regulator
MSANAIRAALRHMPLFADLSDDVLDMVAESAVYQHHPRGQLVFHRGDRGDRAYVVVSGAVDLVIDSPDGRELILSRLGPGEHFGEMALVDDLVRSASARTAQETDLVVVLRQAFLQALNDHPEVSQQVIRSLVTRLRAADQKIEAFAYLDAAGRVARVLLELDHQPGVVLNLSHEELGNMAATSRQTTTKVLGEWEGEGYVELSRRGIQIMDRDALGLYAQI